MKAVILDFDGTIADSFAVFVETLQEIVKRPELLTPQEVKQLRGLTTRQIITHLHIRWWELPRLVIHGRRIIAQKIGRVHVFPGMPAELKKLTADGYKLYIISSNDQTAIQLFLHKHDLAPYIQSVTTTGLNNKARHIRRLLKRHRLTPKNCVYIGDEVRDMQAAHKAGVGSIAVSWGYNTKQALAKTQPSCVVDSPKELSAAIGTVTVG